MPARSRKTKITVERIPYGGWDDAVRASNGVLEVVGTTRVGPRLIRFGFAGGRNQFGEFGRDMGQEGGDEWRIYGGHRLWHAPEEEPRTYVPDNAPVNVVEHADGFRLSQATEQLTGMQKDIDIHFLTDDPNTIAVQHTITNRTVWGVTLAPWALSVMAKGGRAIIPQEDYHPHRESLLPARPIVLWSYTRMDDPRWRWGGRYVELRQDPTIHTDQKVGFLNRKGWMAYAAEGEVFIKKIAPAAEAFYPDLGCNQEIYVSGAMLELESLGPLITLYPGDSVGLTEIWSLHRADVGQGDDAVAAVLEPLVARLPTLS